MESARFQRGKGTNFIVNLGASRATSACLGRSDVVTTPYSCDRPLALSGRMLPLALQDLPRPPELAYLWGKLPPGPRIGLVGRRQPSAAGFRIAFETARRLAALGMTIVSGGAWGIDRAAHLGALRSRGRTLVVAPLRLEEAYPKQNRTLFAAVLARGGAYLSVAELGAIPFGATFARRNELLVALCDVVLFGEMGVPSGASMAGRFAREQDRPRLVLPWRLDAPDTRGTQVELDRGAGGYFRPSQIVRLLEGRTFDNPLYWERSAAVLAAEPPRRSRHSKKGRDAQGQPSAPAPAASPERDPVLAAISSGGSTIDAIVARTGLAAAAVQHRVLLLTLEGAVRRDGAGLLRAGDQLDRGREQNRP